MKEDYEWIGVSAAPFDSPLPSKIAKHAFVSEQVSYYDIADKASQHLRY
jgi:hypothetical protein